MSAQSALDAIENILALINKGRGSPEEKLAAIQKLAYDLRADVQDMATVVYAAYLDPEEPEDFDMDEGVRLLHEQLSKQDFFNLYAFYDDPVRFNDLATNRIRLAMAKALLQIATEVEQNPNPLWNSIVLAQGKISEAIQ